MLVAFQIVILLIIFMSFCFVGGTKSSKDERYSMASICVTSIVAFVISLLL